MVPHFFREPCFGLQGETGGVLKGGTSVIKAITKFVIASRIGGVTSSVDVVSTLACATAYVTDAATMRKHFGFAGGTRSVKMASHCLLIFK